MKMWYSCIRWVVMVSWREIIWDEHLDCRNSNVSFTSLNHLPNATAPADPPDHRRADTVSVSLSILFHRYTQFIIHYLFMKCHALCLIGVLLQIFKWMIEANIKRFSLLPVVWHLQPTKVCSQDCMDVYDCIYLTICVFVSIWQWKYNAISCI